MCGYVSGGVCLLSTHVCACTEPMSVHAEVKEDVGQLLLSLSILGVRVCTELKLSILPALADG